ncbi:hypothetical protein DV737_g3759, partial [Chaetothyriales sp. CBS 132003]
MAAQWPLNGRSRGICGGHVMGWHTVREPGPEEGGSREAAIRPAAAGALAECIESGKAHKDGSLFRQVVRHFENKQYKKGLKAAEQILRKNPNHADTQAMKALIIGTQGHTQDAFALAKTALNNNMKSHVCWHVYGLLYRSEKNFEESIKAYKFALRLEPESVPIQRDLAHLQIQMRDYEGYIASRKNMLQQKPGFRQNWTALAIANHLAGNYEAAENVLTTYEDTLKSKPSRADMEHWEAVLYKNSIIAESGDLNKALDHLDAVAKKSPDVLAVMEMRADYLLRLERNAEAEEAYAALLDRNPEDSAYYHAYIKAKRLVDAPPADLQVVFDALAAKYPKADLPRRRPLDFLSGHAFQQTADAYLRRMLRKGVPSTFANIKHLYSDPSKRDTIQALAEAYVQAEPTNQANGTPDSGHLHSDNDKDRVQADHQKDRVHADNQKDHVHSDNQSDHVHADNQSDHHYNYKHSRDLDKAMSYAEKCIALDPKSVDFLAVKARTLKHRGDLAAAADTMEAARALDEKDRAINTKCAKYQLRSDQNDKALETASKFTQNKTVGGPLGDLVDMQAVCYLTEDGQSYLRQRKLGLALKRFHQLLNIFDLWQDDQFDFHNFSLRKGMIRAYVDMLRWEDHLRAHPFFSRMAVSACHAYLALDENPDLVHGPIPAALNGQASHADLSPAERKKALKKAKREQERMEKAEAEKKAAIKAAKPTPKADQEEGKKEDTDPFGKKLLETKDPLHDALKFLNPLLDFSPDLVDAHLVGFEIHARRAKWLLATKSLLRLTALDPGHADIPAYRQRVEKALSDGQVADRAKTIIQQELTKALP